MLTMADYGPADAWPAHSRKGARDALDEVRSAGWRLTAHTSHSFGTIRCGKHDPACEVTVFSTAGDVSGSVTGKVIRDKLRSCNKRGPVEEHAAPNHLVALGQAERLVEAASRLRRSEHLNQRSEAALEQALEADEQVSSHLLEEAEAALAASASESAAAWPDAHRYGLGDPWPPDDGAAELERAARQQLDIARSGLDSAEDREAFQNRLEAAEARLPPRDDESSS